MKKLWYRWLCYWNDVCAEHGPFYLWCTSCRSRHKDAAWAKEKKAAAYRDELWPKAKKVLNG